VLPERILYKKGPDRQAGFRLLLDCLAGVPELRLDDSERWHELDAIVRQPARGDLTRIEDELDGILCAHLAWLWHHRPEALQVYGSLEEGYIVAPPPPTHPSGLRRSGGGRRVRS
jgi:predicted RNase H-like nuclease